MNQCLMIRTKDRRKFFTHEKNFPQLIEFSRTFGAEISVVKVDSAEIMDLPELAPAICNANYTSRQEPQHIELVEIKLPDMRSKKPTRPKILQKAKTIRNYIVRKFLKNEVVCLHNLKRHFKRYNLTDSCLCSHVSRARAELTKQGYTFKKIGSGMYKIATK